MLQSAKQRQGKTEFSVRDATAGRRDNISPFGEKRSGNGDECLFQKKFAPPLSDHERGGARKG
jgi:hypothetical protein